MQRYRTPLHKITLTTTIMILAGCTTFSQEGGFDHVQLLTKERTNKEAKWIKTSTDNLTVEKTVSQLLTKPLTVDDALTIALLNNKGLQASYANLGIAEADLVQAGRISNPMFSFGRQSHGNEAEYERKFTLPILDLVTMPLRVQIENRRFEQTQLRAAEKTLQIMHETRHAYFSAIAAQESVKYMEQVKIAAEAGAELAQRMKNVGNWNALQQAREQSFYVDATTQLARAKQTLFTERERLTRLLGLSGSNAVLMLPDRLPNLPKTPIEILDIERQAMQNRLDLIMAKRELSNLADSLGLSKATRFVNVLDIGYLHNTNEQGISKTGYEIEFQIPLFDWGNARIAKAEALYMQASNRTAELAINARSEVREAYNHYRIAFDLAKHYQDEIIPLKKKISDEQLLNYNGMLISVFELLADARSQMMSVNASIEALRDYWIAESAMQISINGSSISRSLAGASNISIATEPATH